MREMDESLSERIESQLQTIANNANPSLFMRVSRYNIPLREEKFIERTRITKAPGITDSDIAVCHPRLKREDEDIWVAYVRNGTLHIKRSKNTEAINKTDWMVYSFTADAEACAIAFNSTAKHNEKDECEFVTEEIPWVFWVHDGALKAKLCTPLGVYEHQLAEENVTDVSAVRGPSGDQDSWNLGLTVFFLMNGSIYYRQYLNGEWCDAELIQMSGLNDLDIVAIKAFNTWDYRVGLQILTDDGDMYELYSYTEGIGTRGIERISLKISGESELERVRYTDGYILEHLSLEITAEGERIYGLSAIPLAIENVEDENENWGTTIIVTMDYPNTGGSANEFVLSDSNGNTYACQSVTCNGTEITLEFLDFNLAGLASSVTLTYTQGTLQSPVPLTDSFTMTFVPQHLVPPHVDPPTVSSIYNL